MELMISIHADFDEIFRELELAGLGPEALSRSPNGFSFRGILADSRKLGTNDIFCAIQGSSHDGHALLERRRAHERGYG